VMHSNQLSKVQKAEDHCLRKTDNFNLQSRTQHERGFPTPKKHDDGVFT
jgi:hypothetical protein